jgi:hypothetical protein
MKRLCPLIAPFNELYSSCDANVLSLGPYIDRLNKQKHSMEYIAGIMSRDSYDINIAGTYAAFRI